MAYTKTNWVNDTSPYINAANLNHIENGIKDLESITNTNATNIASVTARVGAVETKAAGIKTTADNALATANTAKSTADNALSTANAAKNTADTAKATAIAAKENADTAKEIVTEGRDLASNLMAVNGVPSSQYAYSTLIITSGTNKNLVEVVVRFLSTDVPAGSAYNATKTFNELIEFCHDSQAVNPPKRVVAFQSGQPKEVDMLYDPTNVDENIHVKWRIDRIDLSAKTASFDEYDLIIRPDNSNIVQVTMLGDYKLVRQY